MAMMTDDRSGEVSTFGLNVTQPKTNQGMRATAIKVAQTEITVDCSLSPGLETFMARRNGTINRQFVLTNQRNYTPSLI